MKRIILFFLCWPVLVWAGDLSVDLTDIPFSQFVKVVYGDVLKSSFVLDTAVLADNAPVTFVVHAVDAGELKRQLDRVLSARGLFVSKLDGVAYIRARSAVIPDDAQVFVYRPVARSVPYLLELSQSLFPPGSFVSSRNQASPITMAGLGAAVPGGAVSVQPGQMRSVSPDSVPSSVNQGLNRLAQSDADVIVFRGVPAEVEKLKALYKQIDVSPGELLVKAVIFEVQTSRSEGSAVDLVLSLLKSKFGVSLDNGAASFGSTASAKLSFSGLDLSAVFAALSSDDRFKVLTAPRVRVRSGASARFSVGNETPVLGSVSYDQNGHAVQSVDYKSSGVIFSITPTVREGGADCSVSQQLSEFVPTTNGVNNSPTLIKRELSTDVHLVGGQVVLIGGLDEDKSSSSDSGVSFLPSFLHARNNQAQNTQILLMLQADRIGNSGI